MVTDNNPGGQPIHTRCSFFPFLVTRFPKFNLTFYHVFESVDAIYLNKHGLVDQEIFPNSHHQTCYKAFTKVKEKKKGSCM